MSRRWLPVMLVTVALPVVRATATSLPAATSGRRVYDFAGVIGPTVRADLEGEVAAVERETGTQIAVVTVTSLEGDSVEHYANAVFNEWGIGRRERNNGVLFLVAPREHRARIEVGYGLEPLLPDEVAGDILATSAIPRFKAGDYSGGIAAATAELARVLRSDPDAARGIAGSAPGWIGTPRRNAFALTLSALGLAALFLVVGGVCVHERRYPWLLFVVGCTGVLAIGAVAAHASATVRLAPQDRWLWLASSIVGSLLTVVFNWRTYRRFGVHPSPKCGARLLLLDEAKQDEKLDAAQRIEEEIGSVDYDVWLCPACLATDSEPYVAWFSGFEKCPRCRHRTYKRETTTVRLPTRESTGLEREVCRCVSCHYSTQHDTTLPELPPSYGDWSGFFGGGSGGSGFFDGGAFGGGSFGSFGGFGGGDFGGGSSGGGGASGSW